MVAAWDLAARFGIEDDILAAAAAMIWSGREKLMDRSCNRPGVIIFR
jgi:hypothetical protein